MKPQRIPSREYLTKSMITGIDPSFFLSQPYLDLNEAVVWKNEHWMWVESDDWLLFTPIRISQTPVDASYAFPKGMNIWCDDINDLYRDPAMWQPKFLDFEYIFDPTQFQNMEGGKWNTFRKNIRKWPRGNPDYMYIDQLMDLKALNDLCVDWFTPRVDAIEDGESILKFILFPHTMIRRKYMYRKNWELVGVNVWDWNYQYINYRLCIAKTGERFLDEFMRFQFYQDPIIRASRKKVNDGGSLGNVGLERFKGKMNPLEKRKRYSLIIRNKA